MNLFSVPTRVTFGAGCYTAAPGALAALGCRRVLIVTRVSSFEEDGTLAALREGFEEHDIIHETCHTVEIEPDVNDVNNLITAVKASQADTVIALGGGSTMDLVKAALVVENAPPGEDADLFGHTDWIRKRRLVAMPTTAGTGSEVTPYSSLKLFKDGVWLKKSMDHQALLPDLAFVDPDLSAGCPWPVTASAGMDALCQAIESYWSKNASGHSRIFSREAVSLVYNGLSDLCRDHDDARARYNLSLGANFAGVGIAHAQTTAIHAASYPLTTLFGLPHGHACALTLAPFLRYNTPWLEEEGRPVLEALDCSTAEEAALKTESLLADLGLECRLSKLGINDADLDEIVRYGFRKDRAGNNPVAYGADDLRAILESVL